MAATKTRRVALFSIRPVYARAILDGRKRVEFRRTGLSSDVAHVVVYSTSPVQRVVGTFEVAGVDNDSPDALWERYAHVGGIDRDAYDRYFAGCDSAYAIRVRRPWTLPVPVPLAHLRPGLRPPQSFQYLDEETAARLGVGDREPDPAGARSAAKESGLGVLALLLAVLRSAWTPLLTLLGDDCRPADVPENGR